MASEAIIEGEGMKKFRYLELLFGLVLLLSPNLFLMACEPGSFPIINNQYHQDVTVWVTRVNDDGSFGEPRDYGIVESNTSRRLASIAFIRRDIVFRIEAKSLGGEIVFARDYKMADLDKIGWKITIPP